ncbi:NUDIX hydrolase [Inconstantimicrobium mannanitabidum]|uniref:ADP-ribose pyrophosphatase n=1 Tax=Inconstantimicrobium mannanitabidum TaxID=1604901 RepID=A0ACB5RAF5_9CLOT|nr:NUDIX hydrolase [Clostridium sp. TW13]GKX66172.1 ADP-ribose pyrophosphatase [Clostridium sp. TW13]
MNFEEKTLEEKLIYKGNFLKVTNHKVQLPNGNIGSRDIVRHPGGVAVVAFLDQYTILLVEQYRKPLELITLELPAGKLEIGEDPEICGLRELEEETGYKAGDHEFLGKIATTPGFCDEYIYLYKATNLTVGTVNMDEDEFVNVKKLKLSEVKEKIKKGEIIDAKTIAALSYL